MADFEDANSPTWEQLHRRASATSPTRSTGRSSSTRGEKRYRLNDEVAVLFVRPRGWHLVERHFEVDGEPISASLFDFGLYFLRNHAPQRPLLLPAQARVAPRGAALERRLLLRAGPARRAARDDQGDGADRDDPRRVRDGRDPLRAARALGRAERRPLGLHLQRDQEARPPARVRAARPQRRDDGGAVHARLLRAARARPATRAARSRWAAWRRSSRRGATPR